MMVRIFIFLLISLNIFTVDLVNIENIIMYKEINLKNSLNPIIGNGKLTTIRKFSKIKLLKEYVTESPVVDDIYYVQLEDGKKGYIYASFTYPVEINVKVVLLKDLSIESKFLEKYSIFELIYSTSRGFTLKDQNNNLIVTNSLKYFKLIVDIKDMNETMIENFNIVRIVDANSLIPLKNIDVAYSVESKNITKKTDSYGIVYIEKNIKKINILNFNLDFNISAGFNLCYTSKKENRFSNYISNFSFFDSNLSEKENSGLNLDSNILKKSNSEVKSNIIEKSNDEIKSNISNSEIKSNIIEKSNSSLNSNITKKSDNERNTTYSNQNVAEITLFHNIKNFSDIFFVNEKNEVFLLEKNKTITIQAGYYEIFYDDINTQILPKNRVLYFDKGIDLEKILQYGYQNRLITEDSFNELDGNYKLQFTSNFELSIFIESNILKMTINSLEYYFYINKDYLVLLYSDSGYVNTNFLNKIIIKYQYQKFDNQLFLKDFEIITIFDNEKTKIFSENSLKKLFSYDILIFQRIE